MTLAHQQRALGILFWAGLLLYTVTALHNIGFVAMDDYHDFLPVAFPATQNISEVAQNGVHQPASRVVFLLLAKLASSMGIDTQLGQFRFILFLWSIVAFLVHAGFGLKLFRLIDRQNSTRRLVYLGLTGFYFLAPFLLTRFMIESISAAFLTASVYFASVYWEKNSRAALVWSLALIAFGSVFRMQVGICAFALGALVLWRKDWKGLGVLTASGAILFVTTGYLDVLFGRAFHGSLQIYLAACFAFIEKLERHPFWVFLVLLFALSLPPTLLSRFRNFSWKSEYRGLIPALVFFVFFVAFHSWSPYKEDRFILPILPAFFMVLTPLFHHLFFIEKSRWRALYFGGLNLSLLVLVVSQVAQKNAIDLANYINDEPKIEHVLSVDQSVTLFPKEFIDHPISIDQVRKSDPSILAPTCKQAVAIRTALVSPPSRDNWTQVGEFHPGFLESVLIRLNPKHNRRRSTIALYRPNHCLGD